VVDRGTSQVVYLEGSAGYNAETALEAVARLLSFTAYRSGCVLTVIRTIKTLKREWRGAAYDDNLALEWGSR
jgi:hypothetical protein